MQMQVQPKFGNSGYLFRKQFDTMEYSFQGLQDFFHILKNANNVCFLVIE